MEEALQTKAGGFQKFFKYQTKPELYAVEILNQNWWSGQIEIARSLIKNRRTVVYSGNAVGKTHAAGGIAQWHFDCFDPGITLTTAPTWTSIHDLLWAEIKSQRPSGQPGRMLDLSITGGPMHYVKGHNAESSSSFQGRHEARQLIIVDESSGIPLYIWDAVNAMMVAPECRELVLGNPIETSGHYYDIRNSPDYNVIRISCLDHPNIIAELAGLPAPYPSAVSLVWIREMLEKHAERTRTPDASSFEFPPGSNEWYNPDDIFRPRVLGLFPKQASQSLWDEKWIDDARTRKLEWTENEPPEIGGDIARFGDDRTTLWHRRGPVVLECMYYGKRDTMETTGWLVDMAENAAKMHEVEAKQIMIKVDDSVTGDVPVIIRRNKRWIDIVPIASLHRKDSLLYSQHTGLEVLSGKGWTNIVHSRRHKVKKEVYDVITVDGRTKVTEDHSLVVGGIETKPKFLMGKIIDTYRPTDKLSESGMGVELAWALGLFAAEGMLGYDAANQNLKARLANTDILLIRRAQKVFQETFSEVCSINSEVMSYNHRVIYRLRFGDGATEFIDRFAYETIHVRGWKIGFGKNTEIQRHKKIPIQILNGNAQIMEAYLAGYMAGDGLETKRECKSDSISLTLTAGLQFIRECLGQTTRVRVRQDKLNVTVLAKVNKGYGVTGEVKQVRSLGKQNDYVYDLETESHTFVAGVGFLVHHNTGLGGGVSDRLRELGYRVVRVIAGSSAMQDDIYYNTYSELWFTGRDRGKGGKLDLTRLPEDVFRFLRADVLAPHYKMESDRRLRVLGKDDTKKRIGRSPDFADGFNLAFYAGREVIMEFV